MIPGRVLPPRAAALRAPVRDAALGPRTATAVAAMDRVFMEQIRRESDEVFLRSLWERLPATSQRRLGVAFAAHATELALASGASWTPLLDLFATRHAPGGHILNLPVPMQPAVMCLTAWLAEEATPATMPIPGALDSVLYDRLVAIALGADRFPEDLTPWVGSLRSVDLLWSNPRLTAAQRDRLVVEAARAAEAPGAAADERPPLAILDGFLPGLLYERAVRERRGIPRGVRAEGTDIPLRRVVAVPTPAQVELLVVAVRDGLLRLEGATTALRSEDTRDLLRLAALPTLTPAHIARLLDAVHQIKATLPAACGALLIGHPHTSARHVLATLQMMRLGANHLPTPFAQRRDLLRDPAIRRYLHSIDTDGEMQRLLMETCEPGEFAESFRRLLATAPSFAVAAILDGTLPPGATVDPAWLIPLLSNGSQELRTDAVLAAARVGAPIDDTPAPSARVR
jgi:hypothetical protein